MTEEESDNRAFRVYKWYMICGFCIMFITAAFSYSLRHELSAAHRVLNMVKQDMLVIQVTVKRMNMLAAEIKKEINELRRDLKLEGL